MIRALGLSATLAMLALQGFAQSDSVRTTKATTGASHYVGIQANQLIKQLLNLGGSTTAVNNPYLITYNVNSNATGGGLNLSLGYVLDATTGGDFQSQVNTEIQEFFFRIGVEKKTYIGRRWLLSAGGDVIIENKKNRTETLFSGTDTPSVDEDKSNAYGTGVRVGLNFHITEKILLGTEANYYLKFITNTNTQIQPFGSPQKQTVDQKKFQLNVPAVLFLVVKF